MKVYVSVSFFRSKRQRMCISTLLHAASTELQTADESEPLRPDCLLARWFFFLNVHESSVQPELWGKSHAAPAAAAAVAADVMGSFCPNHTTVFPVKKISFPLPLLFFSECFLFLNIPCLATHCEKGSACLHQQKFCAMLGRGRNSLNEPSPSTRALQRSTLFWHHYVLREMWFNSSRLSSVTPRWYNKYGRLSSLSRVKRWPSRRWIISVCN